jgi:hypothetical protein
MKGYVCNRAHPEESMIEGYTTEKVLVCYNDYMKNDKPIGVPVSRYGGAHWKKNHRKLNIQQPEL